MEGSIRFIVFLLSISLASAWQTVDLDFLKSLQEDRYVNLLQDLACTNLIERDQLNNCELYMQNENETLTDEHLATQWLEAVNDIQIDVSYEAALATFNYYTNMTDYNQEVRSNVSILNTFWSTTERKQGRLFNYTVFTNATLRRMFEFTLSGGRLDDKVQREMSRYCLSVQYLSELAGSNNRTNTNAKPNFRLGTEYLLSVTAASSTCSTTSIYKPLRRLSEISREMVTIYGKGKVCRTKKGKDETISKSGNTKDYKREEECLTLEPDLEGIIAHSRDYDELLWAWKGWRDAVGPDIGKLYPEWVKLQNIGAVTGKYTDMGQLWRSMYEMEDDGLEAMVDALYEEVKPLYKLFHAFLRRRLSEKYPGRIKTTGPIPAHVFGNMWSQQWNNIYDIAKPYPEVEEVDVSAEMEAQEYDALHMFKVAEKFFMSIGMDPMPENFWKYSMIEKPLDRDVVCHGSASDFKKDREVRIKMCTGVDMEDLYTVHHEMGHCEYYLEYSDQPMVFRGGANPGFHEAVGDTIALSVTTPSYLHTIKLIDSPVNSKEKTINYQMKMALSKIAFLPFGLMIDKWRWEVFRGNIKPEEYNTKWWEYRLKYQGIVPPVERTEDDFDPGAKYHIPSGTPYIRYFVSFLIQFQFQRALCNEAGFEGPLHECNIYESGEAGAKLKEMLELGQSRHWTEALEVLTGQTEIDTSAIKEYFAPLIEWLKENTKDEVLGWDEVVPETDEEPEISEEQIEEQLLEELELLTVLEELERLERFL